MSYIKVIGVRDQPGYALIEIGYVLDVEPIRFTLRRTGADQRYLSRDGAWRGEPDELQPREVQRKGSSTFLSIGPDIVDRLGEDERLRLEIVSAGFVADVVWSDVPPSSGRVGSAVFLSRSRPAPIAEEPPAPEPVLEPPPQPKDEVESEATPSPQPPVDRRVFWALLALVLVILLGGGLAAWHYRPVLVAWWTRLAPGPAPTPTPIDVDSNQRLKQELARLMATPDGDPGRILDGGRRLIDAPSAELRDFGFRAIDVAATRGSASAQFEMGKLYDPRYFKTGRGGMDRANASVAADFYRKATAGGSPEAGRELQGLCALLAHPSADIDDAQRVSVLSQYCN